MTTPDPALASSPESDRTARLTLLPAACIVAAGILAYANSFKGTLILDDISSIVTSNELHGFRPLKAMLWGPPQSTAAGRPVVCLSLALNYALSGLNLWGYHAFNLAVHLLAALTLFGLLRRTLALPAALGLSPSSASWTALVVTMIWTVHPLQTEAVTYIIQRTELLMGLFYLLTMYCCLRAWQSPRPTAWSLAGVAACTLGMLSKETMASAPLAVLLYDRTFVSGTFKAAAKRHWGLYLPLAATWGILVAIIAAGPRSDSIGFHHDLSAWRYLLTQAGVILYYLRLAVVPRPLVVSYQDWSIANSLIDVWPQALLVLTLLAATVVALIRKPASGFLGACFFLVLAPTSSFVPVVTEIVAERRMYLPLAIPVVLAVLAGRSLLGRIASRCTGVPARAVEGVLTAAIAAACLAGTVDRNRDYYSALAMWQKVVSLRPRNTEARANLGGALREANDLPGAEEQFKAALEIDPAYPPALLGMVTLHQKRAEWAQAVALGRYLVRAQPHYSDARGVLVNCLLDWADELAGQNRTDEALARMREAVDLAPGEARLHNTLGLALSKQRRYREAEPCLREAIRLSPAFADAHLNLGFTLVALGQTDDGIKAIEHGLRLKPDARGHLALGDVLAEKGRHAEAVRQYQKALQLDPGLIAAQERLRQGSAR